MPMAYTSNAESSGRRWLSATEIFLDDEMAEFAQPAEMVEPTLPM